MAKSKGSWIAVAQVASALWFVGSSAPAQVVRQEVFGSDDREQYGFASANAGDVNGDGIDDFVVGARGYDAGHGAVYNGRVQLFDGATGAVIRTHVGAASDDQLGFSVAGAGDIDGDGFDDYVAGAIGWSSKTASKLGRVIAWSGKTGATLWTFDGTVAYGWVGYAIAGIGDVDGDDRGDVVISSLLGQVDVVDSVGSSMYTLTEADGFGFAVCGCGDVDGDGVADFAVGKPTADQPAPYLQDCGQVALFSGASGTSLTRKYGPNAFDEIGRALARLGDLDGDGVDDLAIGAWASWAAGYFSGMVLVASGSNGATLFQHWGVAGDFAGMSLTGLDDVNGDGVDDYAFGSPSANGGIGRVDLCSGLDGHMMWTFRGNNNVSGDYGRSIAGGDWNGDGLGDLVIGADLEMVGTNEVGRIEVDLVCPAWWKEYGAGWPGLNGIPRIHPTAVPEVGITLTAFLDNSSLVPTTALLFVGNDPLAIPLKNSGTLLVDPLMAISLPISGTGIWIDGEIPNDPALCFADFYVQAVEFDPAASKGLSFTPGLQLRCGYPVM